MDRRHREINAVASALERVQYPRAVCWSVCGRSHVEHFVARGRPLAVGCPSTDNTVFVHPSRGASLTWTLVQQDSHSSTDSCEFPFAMSGEVRCLGACLVPLDQGCMQGEKHWYASTLELQLVSRAFCAAFRSAPNLRVHVNYQTPHCGRPVLQVTNLICRSFALDT